MIAAALTSIANPKIDFQVIYFSTKRSLAAKYGYVKDVGPVRNPVTPRATARELWSLYKLTYKSMSGFLESLMNLARDPAAATRKTWATQGAIIDRALAGGASNLLPSETAEYWTALAKISIQLNAVQSVSSSSELLASSVVDCLKSYGECVRDAKEDLGIPDLFDFSALWAAMKWGSIALTGVWVYGQIKGKKRR